MNKTNSTVTQKQRLILYFVVQLAFSLAFCCCLTYPDFVLTLDNSSISILPIIFILFIVGSWKWYIINSVFFKLEHVIFNLVLMIGVCCILFVFSHILFAIIYLVFCFFVITKDLDKISERTYNDPELCESCEGCVRCSRCSTSSGNLVHDHEDEDECNLEEDELDDYDEDDAPIYENVDDESSDTPEDNDE